jgi:actin-related protein
MYCDICSNPLKPKYRINTEPFERYWSQIGNLKVCDECLKKDPWEIIEELVNQLNELEWERDNYYEAYQKIKTKKCKQEV